LHYQQSGTILTGLRSKQYGAMQRILGRSLLQNFFCQEVGICMNEQYLRLELQQKWKEESGNHLGKH